MDKYLTTEELSSLIKMTPGTIRNLVWKNVFKENVHYVKPTPRKLLFKRRAVESWSWVLTELTNHYRHLFQIDYQFNQCFNLRLPCLPIVVWGRVRAELALKVSGKFR